MPFLADGSFTPDMPPSNPLAQPLPSNGAQSFATPTNGGMIPTPDGMQINPNAPALGQPLGVAFNRRTGEPARVATKTANADALLNKLATAKQPANPGAAYQQPEYPEFPDWVKDFAAKNDGKDPSALTDQEILGYADTYSKDIMQNAMRQGMLAAGHKPDPAYLKGLGPKFAYDTAKNLPAIKALLTASAAGAPAPAPTGNYS